MSQKRTRAERKDGKKSDPDRCEKCAFPREISFASLSLPVLTAAATKPVDCATSHETVLRG